MKDEGGNKTFRQETSEKLWRRQFQPKFEVNINNNNNNIYSENTIKIFTIT